MVGNRSAFHMYSAQQTLGYISASHAYYFDDGLYIGSFALTKPLGSILLAVISSFTLVTGGLTGGLIYLQWDTHG